MQLTLVLPVYNEEKVLEKSVVGVNDFLGGNARGWEIVIADNASTDGTLEMAKGLSDRYKNVRYIHIDKKGRGRALKKAWAESNADVVGYMDIDLSTDLSALPKAVNAINEGFDVAIGSRHVSSSHVKRSLKRGVLSRGYNTLLKLLLDVKFSDAQCGFKFVTKDVVDKIVPGVKDNEWFFDTELLVRAERNGYRVKEIPVTWHEDPDSRVKIVQTISDYIKSIFRLRKELG